MESRDEAEFFIPVKWQTCSEKGLFGIFVRQFTSQLHQNGMKRTIAVAPWNAVTPEIEGTSGVFWDYAGLGAYADYIADMDYASNFCHNANGQLQNSDSGCSSGASLTIQCARNLLGQESPRHYNANDREGNSEYSKIDKVKLEACKSCTSK